MYGPATQDDSRLFTEDGYRINDGERYYNYYDMYWVVVRFGDGPTSPSGEHWNGWFKTKKEDGSNGPLLNGERLMGNKPGWAKD